MKHKGRGQETPAMRSNEAAMEANTTLRKQVISEMPIPKIDQESLADQGKWVSMAELRSAQAGALLALQDAEPNSISFYNASIENLLLAFYTHIPPARGLPIRAATVSENGQSLSAVKPSVIFERHGMFVLQCRPKPHRKTGIVSLDLPASLSGFIRSTIEAAKVHGPNVSSGFLFVKNNGLEYSSAEWSIFLSKTISKHLQNGKGCSVNAIRSAYVTSLNVDQHVNSAVKASAADAMMHTLKTAQQNYNRSTHFQKTHLSIQYTQSLVDQRDRIFVCFGSDCELIPALICKKLDSTHYLVKLFDSVKTSTVADESVQSIFFHMTSKQGDLYSVPRERVFHPPVEFCQEKKVWVAELDCFSAFLANEQNLINAIVACLPEKILLSDITAQPGEHVLVKGAMLAELVGTCSFRNRDKSVLVRFFPHSCSSDETPGTVTKHCLVQDLSWPVDSSFDCIKKPPGWVLHQRLHVDGKVSLTTKGVRFLSSKIDSNLPPESITHHTPSASVSAVAEALQQSTNSSTTASHTDIGTTYTTPPDTLASLPISDAALVSPSPKSTSTHLHVPVLTTLPKVVTSNRKRALPSVRSKFNEDDILHLHDGVKRFVSKSGVPQWGKILSSFNFQVHLRSWDLKGMWEELQDS